jgi:hypothetical protein
MGLPLTDVRFTPKSGHCSARQRCPLSAKSGHPRKRTSELGQFVRRNSSGSSAILAVSNLLPEDAGAGDSLCRGKLLPIIGWTEVAFEFLQGVAK